MSPTIKFFGPSLVSMNCKHEYFWKFFLGAHLCQNILKYYIQMVTHIKSNQSKFSIYNYYLEYFCESSSHHRQIISIKLLESNYCRSKLCQDIITFFLSARILSLFSRQNVMVTDTYTMISDEFYIFPTVYCFNIHLFFQKYTIWIESLCFAFCCFSCCFKTFIFPKQHWIQEEMNSVESFFLKGSAIFIEGKRKMNSKYELELRYLSKDWLALS